MLALPCCDGTCVIDIAFLCAPEPIGQTDGPKTSASCGGDIAAAVNLNNVAWWRGSPRCLDDCVQGGFELRVDSRLPLVGGQQCRAGEIPGLDVGAEAPTPDSKARGRHLTCVGSRTLCA